MDRKAFLMPKIGKLVIFFILMFGLNYMIISSTVILDGRTLVGLPLGFWPIGSFMVQTGQITPAVEFSWIPFAFDIFFWYLVSCGIVALYCKVKK